MNKKQFMLQLKWHLLTRLSADKRKGIIEDYNAFFDEGTKNGQTEEALCARFGSPRDIAAELAGAKLRFNLPVAILFAVLAVVAVFYILPFNTYLYVNYTHRYVIGLASLAVAIYIATAQRLNASKLAFGAVVGGTALNAAAFAACVGIILYLPALWQKEPMVSPVNLGNTIGFMVYMSSILSMLCLAVVIAAASRVSRFAVFAGILAFFIISSNLELSFMMGDLSHPDMFNPGICILAAALTNLPAFAAAVLLHIKRGAKWTHK